MYVVSLAEFTRRQMTLLGIDAKTLSKRSGLGLSHIYQIIKGERPRPSAGTLDAIARGFGMTPAEMAIAMGRATPEDDPEESELVALFRLVPTSQRQTVKQILRGLAIQPLANGLPGAPANGLKLPSLKLARSSADQQEIELEGRVTPCLSRVLASVLSIFRPLAPVVSG
jgi:transcriptional regulator with XRE-family HTH domain